MLFHSFLGNDEVKKQLSNLVDGGRLPQAIIIEGPDGSGKRTLSRLIAAAAVCTDERQRPCMQCSACKKAAAGSHPDIFEESGSGTARSFHVETIRNIRTDVFVVPNEAKRKIYILGNAQSMSEQAQNALLKVLEEPPEYALFILTCDSRSHLLPTVLSRSEVFTLGAVSEEQAVEAVAKELPDIPDERIREAATVWNCIIGQMIGGLKNGKLNEAFEIAPQIANAVTANSELELLKLTANFEKDRELFRASVSMLILIFRDAFVCSAGGKGSISGQTKAAENLAVSLTLPRLKALIETAEKIKESIDRNANNNLLITEMCSSLRRAAGR